MHRKEVIFCLAVLVPFLIQFCIFWIYANFNSIRLAFTYYKPLEDSHVLLPFSRLFENFGKFIGDIFSESGFAYVLNEIGRAHV